MPSFGRVACLPKQKASLSGSRKALCSELLQARRARSPPLHLCVHWRRVHMPVSNCDNQQHTKGMRMSSQANDTLVLESSTSFVYPLLNWSSMILECILSNSPSTSSKRQSLSCSRAIGVCHMQLRQSARQAERRRDKGSRGWRSILRRRRTRGESTCHGRSR